MIRKSKAEICEYVHQFSTACAQFALTEHDGKLDLPKVYEYLSHVWGGWQPIVLEKEEMGDRLGFTDPVRKIIALREDVYDGMCSGEKEHLYTAAHELGVASRTIIWSLVKQVRVRLVPLFHGLHWRFALER